MEPPSPRSPQVGPETPRYDSPHAPSKHVIDTAAPIESVKDAVSKFGGRIDWKSRRTQSMERSKLENQEIGKAETAEELENTKKLIEELKHNLERAEKDELEAKEETEKLSLKIDEIEEDIVNEATNEAKAQLEAEKARHTAAVSELEFARKELESLSKEYASMVSGRDVAIKKAEEAAAASKEAEKEVENLTNELIATKESLDSTKAEHMEAEEKRLRSEDDEESHKLKLELEEAEENLNTLTKQVLSARDLKSKLDASSSLLHDLKAELAAYMGSKLKEESEQERKMELEEVKLSIEKATDEVNSLKEASELLKLELEEEKLILAELKKSEENASAKLKELQDELEKTKSTIAFLQMKEEKEKDVMVELPNKLLEAQQEADEAKALAMAAQEELLKAQEEAEEAMDRASSLEARLLGAQKEIEASKVTEKLAKDAIEALEKSDHNDDNDSNSMVTLTLDEYHELSKRTHKAEEQANGRVAAAQSQIEMAKESELKSLKKLEELKQELSVRKESLNMANLKAEKAKEGKIAVEEELRTWMAQQEKQQKEVQLNQLTNSAEKVSKDDSVTFKCTGKSKGKAAATNGNETAAATNGNETAADTKNKKKKKKKSFFPTKVVMFFAKRKTHPTK